MSEAKEFQDLTASIPFWNNKPSDMKEGDTITGKVVLIQESRDAKSSRTATLEVEGAEGTERIGVWLSTVIDGAFKAGVVEGDTVRITYKGKGKTKNNTDFNDYKVEVAK